MKETKKLINTADLNDENSSQKIAEKVSKDGFCTIDNAMSEKQLIDIASKIGRIVMHEDADSLGIMHIRPNEDSVDEINDIGGAFTRSALPPHTDGKGIKKYEFPDGEKRNGPAEIIILHARYVEDPASAIFKMCDGKKIYEYLKENDKELFTFLNSDKAIKKYTTQPNYMYNGPLFENINNLIAIRLNVRESKNWKEGYLDRLLNIIEKLSFEMPLNSNQGIIFDNRRMLHGRSPIKSSADRYLRHILVYVDKNKEIGKNLPIYSI